MAENTVVYQGTGRRKNAVARVRLVPRGPCPPCSWHRQGDR